MGNPPPVVGRGCLVTCLKTGGQPQQQPGMQQQPKQEQNADTGDGAARAEWSARRWREELAERWATQLQTMTETMEHPEFNTEQLPELWQQSMGHGVTGTSTYYEFWKDGIEALYRRCETYPQHAQLARTLSGMSDAAWCDTGKIAAQADDLAHQATPTEIQQALVHERQHPESWWKASDHILTWATDEQLTGEVIEQLPWNNHLLDYATTAEQLVATDPAFEQVRSRRRQHIVEHIQQQLLGGNKNAWVIFRGIVEPGHNIGETAELAVAIEQQRRPVRQKTQP